MPSGRLSTMNVDQVKTEVVEQAEIIKRLIGVYPRYIRLPFGEVSAEVETAIYSMGYVSTYWNIDSADYRACQNIHGYTGADMVGAYTREFQAYRNAGNLKGAFIALQHDSCPIGPYVRDVVKACGDFEYRIVTMDKCLGHDDPYKYAADSEGIRPTAGNGGTGGNTQNGGTQDNGKQGPQSVGGGSGASSVQVSLSMMISAVVVGLIGVLMV
ncbi:hypothetical protein BKA69DRAFT_94879 [Paraphysoderma sedebokerense]|nr:hypothetical protein BKA69DRAFT_94879 [Paraphysoderma sedebokerense]